MDHGPQFALQVLIFKFLMGKSVSNLKMNIMKIGKMLKSEKFILIFAKIWTEKRKVL